MCCSDRLKWQLKADVQIDVISAYRLSKSQVSATLSGKCHASIVMQMIKRYAA